MKDNIITSGTFSSINTSMTEAIKQFIEKSIYYIDKPYSKNDPITFLLDEQYYEILEEEYISKLKERGIVIKIR